MDNSTRSTFIISASAVAVVGISALVWWITRRRRENVTLGTGSTGGNTLTGIVQNVVDTIHEVMGMQYFTVNELCSSATARARGIDNTPTPEIRSKLETLITQCLDPIRRIYGKPIIVTSGYRCPELNRAVGGASTSQHLYGEAADLVPAYGGSLAGIFRAAVQFGNFDQLLIERTGASRWVHVSYGPRMRRRILANNNGHWTDITNSWESYINNFA